MPLRLPRPTRPEDCPLYIASPYGFSEAGREFYYSKFIPAIKAQGFPILDPWVLTPQSEIDKVLAMPYGPEKRDAWRSLNWIIGGNNANAILNSRGTVAVLDGVDVDSGTASEIGYSCGQGNPILGYRGDFRLSADNEGSIVNLQVEFFIRDNRGKVVASLAELESSLKDVFLEE